MYKYAWLSDLDLINMSEEDKLLMIQKIVSIKEKEELTGILITGNTSNGTELLDHIDFLRVHDLFVLYVLGNQDFWSSNFNSVQRKVISAKDVESNVQYLSNETYMFLPSTETLIIGTDSFADGMCGKALTGFLDGQDIINIEDLKYAHAIGGESELKRKIYEFSVTNTFKLAAYIDTVIEEKKSVKNIVLLAHAPAFRENCATRFGEMGPELLPLYCNQNLGDMLLLKAKKYTDIKFLVLSGKVHFNTEYSPITNLTSRTGYAQSDAGFVIDVVSL